MKLLQLAQYDLDQGHCWITKLPDDLAPGETVGKPRRTELRLFEDEKELGPARSSHEVIRKTGLGTYSHWEKALYFSTSDNSSPLHNGRKYHIVTPANTEDRDKDILLQGVVKKTPVNYCLLDTNTDKAKQAAAYAIEVARSYVKSLPNGLNSLKGKSVLELGPGTDFGAALILACWGARDVAVCDRFLCEYQHPYHTIVYEYIAEQLAAGKVTQNLSPIEKCISSRAHAPDEISCHEKSLESLIGSTNNQFDIIVSNAVLEHLYHPLQGLRALWKLTRTGGMGLHQVDFRDHRNFNSPLEYLLMDEFSFLDILQTTNCECGNRIRPHQMHAMFEVAGFRNIKFAPNLLTEDFYLDEFLSRLRASKSSTYSDMDRSLLKSISGQFSMVK